MRLNNLADVLRAAGLSVVEVPGWRNRGVDLVDVQAIICHHTAGAASGNYPSLATVRDGRPDVPGPLSELGLGRDGTWFVIAAGRANHAGKTSKSWQTSSHTIGIEAEAQGTGAAADWPAVQMESYARGVAALAAAYGVPNDRVLGHKEIAAAYQGGPVNGRKIDPSFDMGAFRARVRNTTQEDDMSAEAESKIDDLADAIAGDVVDKGQKISPREALNRVLRINRQLVKALEEQAKTASTRHQASFERERATLAQVSALSAGMKALAEVRGLDGDELVAAITAAATEALSSIALPLKGEITLTTKEP